MDVKKIFVFSLLMYAGFTFAVSDGSRFINKMRVKLSPNSEVMTNQFTRLCGSFRVLNEIGQEIMVYMSGSTHEWDVKIDNSENTTIFATHDELKFIKECLKPQDKRCDLLVEQGDEKAEGNLLGKIKTLSLPKTIIKSLKIEKLAESNDRNKSEMDEISRLFRNYGLRVYNFDLIGNVDALEYIFKTRGTTGVFQALEVRLRQFFKIKNPQHNFPIELINLGDKIIQSSGLETKIQSGEFAKFVKNSQRKFDKTKNTDREKYMVYQIQRQKKDICILAHSIHITNIIELLLPQIKEFKVLKTEQGRDGKVTTTEESVEGLGETQEIK